MDILDTDQFLKWVEFTSSYFFLKSVRNRKITRYFGYMYEYMNATSCREIERLRYFNQNQIFK